MTRRLACARIMQESNALCPVPTELVDFEDSHYLVGGELRAALRDGGHEVAGFFRKAELAGFCDGVAARGDVVPVPLMSAWASSGGPLSRACFDELLTRLTDGLRPVQVSS